MEYDNDPEGHGLAPLHKKRHVALITAITATVIAAGAITYGVRVRGDRNTKRAALAKIEEENKALANALEMHRGEKAGLDSQLTVCKQELTTQQTSFAEVDKKRTDLDSSLAMCQASVKDLAAENAEAKALVEEFKGLTAKFKKMIDSGKLEVVFRRGQMVVKLPAAILFPSGSDDFSDEGKAALAEVASVLRQVRGRRFTVAGHTDNIPVASGKYSSNWELSAARAVKVTELLVQRGVSASRLVAAGYGEYDPVAGNGSAGGRQKNRRIEIILEPDLKALPEVATVTEAARKKPAPKKHK